MYARGYGVEADVEEARTWFLQAAEQGDTQSMYQLWLTAEGRPQAERDEAVRWLRLAAVGGERDAMWYLGDAYLDGDCVPQDPIQAARWFMASVAAGGSGQQELAVLASELTPEQLQDADRMAGGDGSIARDLIERFYQTLREYVDDLRDLSRPSRKKSAYPTLVALHNSLSRFLDGSGQTDVVEDGLAHREALGLS